MECCSNVASILNAPTFGNCVNVSLFVRVERVNINFWQTCSASLFVNCVEVPPFVTCVEYHVLSVAKIKIETIVFCSCCYLLSICLLRVVSTLMFPVLLMVHSCYGTYVINVGDCMDTVFRPVPVLPTSDVR